MTRDPLDWAIIALMALFGFLLLFCVTMVVDLCWIDTETQYGKVLAKSFSGARTTTTTGLGFGADGKVMPVTATSHSSAQWELAVQFDSGDVRVVSASSSQWAETQEAARVAVVVSRGHLTGLVHECHLKGREKP